MTCIVGAALPNAEAGGTFLVGYRGRLFKVESDFQVAEARSGYDACGCGEDFALGAMHVLAPGGMVDPYGTLQRALKAAEEHSAGVRGPFLILSTP